VGTGAKRESKRKGIKQMKITNSHSSQSFAIVSNASNRTGTRFLLLALSQLNGFNTSELIYLHSVATRVLLSPVHMG